METQHQAKIRVVIYGAVHGVNYRRWLKRAALARGVDGWARNRSDGTVEAVLAGSTDKVGLILLRCYDGPNWATVENILIESCKRDVRPGFRIRKKQILPVNRNKIVLNYLKDVARKIRRRWKGYVRGISKRETYRHWLEQNPTSNFKHFYVENIKRHLDGKERSHRTLGPQPRKRGETILRRLIDLGLKPSDVVVDYGCGTLREGIYLIRYLEAGNYIGLDVDQRILDTAQRLAGETLISEKKPFLSVIDSESLSRSAAAHPDWVVSSEVLTHVPPRDLDEYLDNLVNLINEDGRAILNAPLAKRTIQYSPTGWYHGRNRLARGLARRGLTAVPTKTRRLNRRATKVQIIVSAKPLPRGVGLDESLAG